MRLINKPYVQSKTYLWHTVSMLTVGSISFQRCTVALCKSKDCKITSCQSGALKKILPPSLSRTTCLWPRFESRMVGNSQNLTDCNFAALWLTETYSTSLEKSWPVVDINSAQVTSGILKKVFGLSKHFHYRNYWNRSQPLIQVYPQ